MSALCPTRGCTGRLEIADAHGHPGNLSTHCECPVCGKTAWVFVSDDLRTIEGVVPVTNEWSGGCHLGQEDV